MDKIYGFLIGPGAWIAFSVFILGCICKIGAIILATPKKDRVVLAYFSPKYGFRSLIHWLIPFGTISMQENPLFTLVSFAFHFCVLIVPLFITGHVVLVETFWSVSWWTIPDKLGDILTLIVLLCLAFFWGRRLWVKEVKFVTSWTDFLLLSLVTAPFLFGFIAYHGWIDYKLMLVLHVLSAEILLIAFPFTRLIHMFVGLLTRVYIGSEFGGVRHVKDW
ncbi:MAG: nitrate reductase [Desulfonauticus sp.]|nr:nitrate reductase [Desulfonauticus sp.]